MNDARIPAGRAITLSDKVAALREPRSREGATRVEGKSAERESFRGTTTSIHAAIGRRES
ncbi:hypothetical protein BDI4_1200055 [Burkholderia diffusa]|uniref:hypothetical protein n=1 Tax=Burkholderia diffusa TaxID=488732 RepID=UPI001CB63750|nr:hypothetical protein [Burkholderia diffusa]CAG9242980.1 hypothetical protein BDI4_1200055 [Burkholderia diffusa]